MGPRRKTFEHVDVSGKRVLLRVDFNVPINEETGAISDDSRIRASLPTINRLRDQGATLILCSHFGRPKGRVVESMRLAPARRRLEELLGVPVIDAGGPAGDGPARLIAQLPPGGIAMLENLRFDPREEKNDPSFARELAALADLYVNDAFGAAHRAHASTAGVADFLPAVAGLLMQRELEMLGKVVDSPEQPVVAVIGGAKVSDKITVLKHLGARVGTILIGGGMVSAFLRARGYSGGGVEVPQEEIEAARGLLESRSVRVLIPSDVVAAEGFSPDAPAVTVAAEAVPGASLVLDIGPDTARKYGSEIAGARTVVWNGPMGVAEWSRFAAGTHAIARAIAENSRATTVLGGGSTAEVVGALGLADHFTHVSTGGGASLEFLEGKTLPGVAALLQKEE